MKTKRSNAYKSKRTKNKRYCQANVKIFGLSFQKYFEWPYGNGVLGGEGNER